MMKKILIFTMLILAGFQVQSQTNPKILKAKKMFFAKELSLSMDQIESFWPIYEQMRTELQDIANQKKIACKDPERINECLNKDEVYVQARNKYLLRISNIIGREKAMRIPSVERDFVAMVKESMDER